MAAVVDPQHQQLLQEVDELARHGLELVHEDKKLTEAFVTVAAQCATDATVGQLGEHVANLLILSRIFRTQRNIIREMA